MAFSTSEEALPGLNSAAQNMTATQVELARLAKIKIDSETPRLVAAAMLRVALRRELELKPRLEIVSVDGDDFSPPDDKDPEPREEMHAEEKWARVAHDWLTKRIAAHKKHRLRAGDLVLLHEGDSAEVSSIGADGRVYFKGGEGFSAWPDKIKKIVRREDTSTRAIRLRKDAANFASKRSSPRLWSAARAAELADWHVTMRLTDADVEAFTEIVENAADERPIQRYLEAHPQILGSLIGGNERYCIPRKRLGDRFIPDFVLGDVDSLGIRWSLVELETPRSGISLKNGLTLDKYARKGAEQVATWRKWIGENLGHVRARRSEGGLGLFDIDPSAPAFVIVGRRALRPKVVSEDIRLQYRNENKIEIHTYDWLLDRLRGAVNYSGVPRMSPFLLSPTEASKRG